MRIPFFTLGAAAMLLVLMQASSCSTKPCDSSVVDHAGNLVETWNVPTRPMPIVGPISYVGTEGLGVFLITTKEGHILLGGAKPGMAKAIEHSIRALGKDPKDIKILLCNHAHIDHAGTMAYFKALTGGQVTVMKEDRALLESGGAKGYGLSSLAAGRYPEVHADRVLHDGETVELGGIKLKAHLTPGHTKGSTTFVTTVEDAGRKYGVAFPDGTGINPFTRLVNHPSYEGISDDYRKTFRVLKKLKPDIYLSYHSEDYNFLEKRKLAKTKGVEAWVDPGCYEAFVKAREERFEELVAKEKQGQVN